MFIKAHLHERHSLDEAAVADVHRRLDLLLRELQETGRWVQLYVCWDVVQMWAAGEDSSLNHFRSTL